MSTYDYEETDWPSGDSALAQAVRWIGEHGGDVSWVQNPEVYSTSYDGSAPSMETETWIANVAELNIRSMAAILELGAFGFYASIDANSNYGHDYLAVMISSEQNEMCKLIAASKDEARLEAETRLFAIRKLADTPLNNEKERMQLERVEKLIEQVRIFKLNR